MGHLWSTFQPRNQSKLLEPFLTFQVATRNAEYLFSGPISVNLASSNFVFCTVIPHTWYPFPHTFPENQVVLLKCGGSQHGSHSVCTCRGLARFECSYKSGSKEEWWVLRRVCVFQGSCVRRGLSSFLGQSTVSLLRRGWKGCFYWQRRLISI